MVAIAIGENLIRVMDDRQLMGIISVDNTESFMSSPADIVLKVEELQLSLEQDKYQWIFLHGSDLLQRSIIQGYESERRYLAERVATEHPGFREPAKDEYIRKTDSPPAACLKACAQYDGSYCSEVGFSPSRYYVTIDDYLGAHTIVKQIRNPYRMSRSDRLYSQSRNSGLKPMGVFCLMLMPLAVWVALLCSAPPYRPLTSAQERELTRELLAPIPLGAPLE
ncbi:hypothetical protein [Chamaesiphon sp.]|uniref:hypothetical protein n=1 Tax=Chamaesiphon sp. TaxID=2814140 RepID=UPI003593DC24